MSRPTSVILNSPFFYPEQISTGRYNTYLARSLVENGCDLTVVCSHPFYPKWVVDRCEDSPSFPVQILRGGGNNRFPRSQVLRRLLLEVWFAWHWVWSLRKRHTRDCDVIIDIYPPNMFALLRWRRKKRSAKLIGIVHDLQGVMAEAKTSTFRQLIGMGVRWIERIVLLRADTLVFLSHGMKEYAVQRYGVADSDCHVSYPFSTLSKCTDAQLKVPGALAECDGPTIVYSGALGEKQAPYCLYELLSEFVTRRPEFNAFIFSNGPIFEDLKVRADKSASPVNFHDLVPSDELSGLLSRSTVQVIPQELGLSDGAFPSKLPNLIAAGTAVFAVTDSGSELENILDSYSRGLASTSWDLESNLVGLSSFVDSLEKEPNLAIDDELRREFDVNSLCQLIINSITSTRSH